MFKYFNIDEFNCQETGENEMSEEFIHKLDELREVCGFPFQITSGFRSKEHSIEKRKKNPGQHAFGIACDVAVNGGAQRMKIVEQALLLGFTGIGVANGFVHVDIRESTPVLWCY